MTINVQLNHAPVAVSSSAVADMSRAYRVSAPVFHFSDLTDPVEPLKAVLIDTMPSHGTLTLTLPGAFPTVLNGPTTVQASESTHLMYTQADGLHGADPFNIRVQDSGGTAQPPGFGTVAFDTSLNDATMTINVQLNHAPVAVASSAVTVMSHAHRLAASDSLPTRRSSDLEPLKAVLIDTMPSHGTLTLTLPGAFPTVLNGPTTV